MNSTELVLQQESFFNGAATDGSVMWQKESQFAIQALGNNEYLGKTALNNPVSLQNAIINVAAIGISLNPALKHAYLVPRSLGKDKPTVVCLDISYQGLLHLAMQSGSIEWGQSKIVYANDEYENVGIDKAPIHKQKTFGEKGDIVGVYCTVKTGRGDYLTEEMDIAAVNKVKASSRAQNGPWKTWFDEMARKTVVKRAYKYWPKSESVGMAIDVLNESEGLTPVEKEVIGEVVSDTCDDNQVKELTRAIVMAGMTVDQFCSNKKIGISGLSEFPTARLAGAINWLKDVSMQEVEEKQ